LPIGAAHKPYPIGVGWRGIQRRVVRLGLDAGTPEAGLKLARELAMTTYRTPEEFSVHRVEPENITTPTVLMTAISDQLAPLTTMRELRDRLAGPSELFTFTSLYGHDAFLKEYDAMAPRLEEFCKDILL